MKEMIQKFFGTTKKAVLSVACAVMVLALAGAGVAYAANRNVAGEKTSQVFETTEETVSAADSSTAVSAETTVTSDSSTTASAEAITADAAKEVALADAGLSADAVTFTKTELDYDNGMIVYDIEFYAENVEYEYEVNANTGVIYSKSKESYVTTENAGNTVASGTDTTASSGTASTAETTTNNATASTGAASTAETTTNSTTASTGAASTAETTTNNATASTGTTTTAGTTTTGSTGTTSSQITLDSAKSIALTDAGVSSSDATFTKEKQDYENGVLVYDIEFYTSAGEYEYEIRVSDGAIVSKSVEEYTSSGSGSGTASDSYISVDEAKEIALNKAGLSSSDVTFKKAKLDRDDGIMVYEIEFYYGRTEYEVKINATTGAILEYEMDT